MATDSTISKLFDKFDEVIKNQADIRERLARVEEKQDSHYVENDNSHNDMRADIVEIKTKVESLEEDTDEQQSALDIQHGKRQIREKAFEYLIMLLSGGLLVAVGGYLAKMFGILR